MSAYLLVFSASAAAAAAQAATAEVDRWLGAQVCMRIASQANGRPCSKAATVARVVMGQSLWLENSRKACLTECVAQSDVQLVVAAHALDDAVAGQRVVAQRVKRRVAAADACGGHW